MFKKFMLSAMTLLFTAATLVTTTYAWLEINQQAKVEGLEFSVTNGKGILVSISGLDNTYQQSISTEDIKKAIVFKYKGEALDLSFSPTTGNLCYNKGLGNALTNEEVENYYNQIRLVPLTTSDTKSFYDQWGNKLDTPSSGKYVSFDLHFTTTSTETSANPVSIYFYDGTAKMTEQQTVDEINLSATSIRSESEIVNIGNYFSTRVHDFDKTTGEIKNVEPELEIKPMDAMRISTTWTSTNDLSYNPTGGEDNFTKIYELNEGRGSYCANITEDNYLIGASSNAKYLATYDEAKNIQQTYNQALFPTTSAPLDVSKIPQTIKNFDSYEDAKVCTIQSRRYQTVTFNIWLEGYDSDCITGIGKVPITVSLSFTTTADLQTTRSVEFLDAEGNVYYTRYSVKEVSHITPIVPPIVLGKKFIGWSVDGSNPVDLQAEGNTLGDLLTRYKDFNDASIQLKPLYE